MPIVVGDRVLETSTTSGGGTLTLAGAGTGFQSFVAGVGVGNQTYYTIYDPIANTWEVGLGTLLTGTTLARNTVFSNSAGTTALISFAANSKNVFCTSPASKYVDQSDVGSAPNQIPLNQYLGDLAYMDVVDTISSNPYYDTAISDVEPTLLLDFVNSKNVDPRITFTRGTTARYYDSYTSALAEQNLVTWSQEFDNAAWGKFSCTITANSTIAPDGTTTAETLTGTAGSYSQYVQPLTNITSAASTVTNTYSVYLKAGTISSVRLLVYNLSGGASINGTFDLTNITATAGGTAMTPTVSITDAGNGWRRCVVTGHNAGGIGQTAIPVVYADNGTFFIWGFQAEQRSFVTAYTATTTSPITNYVPVLMTAPVNAPRLDYNPVTRVPNGLLIEEARTNLFSYSDDFSNAFWTKSSVSLSSNTIVAPDGTLTADKIVLITGSHQKRVNLTSGTYTANTYTMSCYAKAGEYGFLLLALYDTGYKGTVFNLNNGTIGSSASSTPSITPVGNGWYRCAITVTTTSTLNTAPTGFWPYATDLGVNGPAEPNGNGWNGLYIWGAQLELAAFPTSYIPTLATTVTRSKDDASMTGTNFSSWYNQAQGTFYVDVSRLTLLGNQAAFGGNVSVGTYDVVLGPTNVNFRLGTGVSPDLVFNNINLATKIAASYKEDADHFLSVNGGDVVIKNMDLSIIPISSLAIGYSPPSSFLLNGYIRKFQYYPLRLSNAELQEMTL